VLVKDNSGTYMYIFYSHTGDVSSAVIPANGVVDERVEVLTPRLARWRRTDHVFQQHVPSNDERPQLTHAHVTTQVNKSYVGTW